jgi:hypothetical protein
MTWSRFTYDPQVDFGDVSIHPADTSAFCGPISCFMNSEYLNAWDLFFRNMVRAFYVHAHNVLLFPT